MTTHIIPDTTTERKSPISAPACFMCGSTVALEEWTPGPKTYTQCIDRIACIRRTGIAEAWGLAGEHVDAEWAEHNAAIDSMEHRP